MKAKPFRNPIMLLWAFGRMSEWVLRGWWHLSALLCRFWWHNCINDPQSATLELWRAGAIYEARAVRSEERGEKDNANFWRMMCWGLYAAAEQAEKQL